MRAVLLKVAGGERIPPEFVRAVLPGCLKVGALNAAVFTMPSKSRGLRIQTSDIILGEPGVGKRDVILLPLVVKILPTPVERCYIVF